MHFRERPTIEQTLDEGEKAWMRGGSHSTRGFVKNQIMAAPRPICCSNGSDDELPWRRTVALARTTTHGERGEGSMMTARSPCA
jgi:hypothetical protein